MKSTIVSHSYAIVMVISAGIAMVKLIAFANYVSPEHFNAYVIPLSLGSFLAYTLSLGLVESTTKNFSRLFADKKELIALGSYRYIVPVLLKRGLFLVGITAIYFVVFEQKSFVWVLCICLIAITVSGSTLLASMQRSTMKTNVMAGTSLIRATMSAISVFIGYSFSPFYGPIIGEVIAQLLSLFVGFFILIKAHRLSYKDVVAVPVSKVITSLKEKQSLKVFLFLASLIMSIPLYLDRYYFELNYSIIELAPYSLCAIVLGASYLVFNTLYQRAGPMMIIEYKMGKPPSGILFLAVKTALVGVIFLSLFFAFIILAYRFGFVESLFSKYSVSPDMLFLVFAISIFTSTAIFEGVFLSFDQEGKFLQCSFFYLACLGLLVLLNFLLSFSLVEFLLVYLFLKMAHFLFMVMMLGLYVKGIDFSKVVV